MSARALHTYHSGYDTPERTGEPGFSSPFRHLLPPKDGFTPIRLVALVTNAHVLADLPHSASGRIEHVELRGFELEDGRYSSTEVSFSITPFVEVGFDCAVCVVNESYEGYEVQSRESSSRFTFYPIVMDWTLLAEKEEYNEGCISSGDMIVVLGYPALKRDRNRSAERSVLFSGIIASDPQLR